MHWNVEGPNPGGGEFGRNVHIAQCIALRADYALPRSKFGGWERNYLPKMDVSPELFRRSDTKS